MLENPIHWFAWKDDDAAFKAAKELNRPVFLSVGYSTCHWCHVMARESFEDGDIAAFLNSHFVCIKVDKEERPDVDAFYMKYVQATQGGGGWPMSVFMTPEKKPFFAGSYFPPNDRFGRPGFLTVVQRIAEVWETRQSDVESSAEDIMEQLQGVVMMEKETGDGVPVGRAALDACAAMLMDRYDKEHGGFGGPPKFPRPCEMQSIFMASSRRSDAAGMQDATLSTLKKMAEGGLRDQLGGGFHRYSVDEIYHVPHFEIMLYDQPQIALTYLIAFQLTGDVSYACVFRGILDYMMQSLKSPVHGGYFAAEDADSLCTATMTPKEGAFYTWTTAQVDACFDQETMRQDCKTFFGITSQGNCTRSSLSDPHQEFVGTNVLYQAVPLEDMAERKSISVGQMDEALSTMRRVLYDARNKRPHPHRDEKIISAWNGMAMDIFALAGVVLESEDPPVEYSFPVRGVSPRDVYLKEAENIASFMKNTMIRQDTNGTPILYRSFVSKDPTIRGFSDDYSWTIRGLITLFEATGDFEHLELAVNIQDSMDSLFWDAANKGYYQSDRKSSGSLGFRLKDDYDGAEPAASSIAASNLIRLSALTDNQAYTSRAADMIQSVSSKLEQVPLAMPQMCMAAYENDMPHTQVILIGKQDQPDYTALVTTAFKLYIPNRTIIQIDPDNEDTMQFWTKTNPRIAQMVYKSNTTIPVALVCANRTCQKPVHEASSLESLLLQLVPAVAAH